MLHYKICLGCDELCTFSSHSEYIKKDICPYQIMDGINKYLYRKDYNEINHKMYRETTAMVILNEMRYTGQFINKTKRYSC